jgi:hypothetical protein
VRSEGPVVVQGFVGLFATLDARDDSGEYCSDTGMTEVRRG